MQGVALGTTTAAQWKQMGAAIVAGVEAGWVNPVINKVREREREAGRHQAIMYILTQHFFLFLKSHAANQY